MPLRTQHNKGESPSILNTEAATRMIWEAALGKSAYMTSMFWWTAAAKLFRMPLMLELSRINLLTLHKVGANPAISMAPHFMMFT